MKKVKKITWKLTYIKILFLFFLILSPNIYGQDLSSDEFYNNHLRRDEFNSELPSERYYNNNLRNSEWEDDGGPGGSGDGSNQGVGVPLPKGIGSIITCILAYGVFIYFRKKR